jgi:hypothetical protein
VSAVTFDQDGSSGARGRTATTRASGNGHFAACGTFFPSKPGSYREKHRP